MTDRVGQKIGNYLLTNVIGKGGFADVYLGEHIHLGTLAAIKILHTKLTNNEVIQFRNEARLIANLVHFNIVRVLDFGVEPPVPFLVMDYASQGTLRTLHPRGSSIPLDLVVSYTKQIADALQYAHDMTIIHRDVKPENMLLGQHNEILLSDFGIAIGALNTSTQEIVGTPAYMAPEQLQGRPQRASDQYALAIVVYEWLCGHCPFNGSTMEIMHQNATMSPPALHSPSISQDVEDVVFRALGKDPKDRFTNIREFALALEEASRHSIIQAQLKEALLERPQYEKTWPAIAIESSQFWGNYASPSRESPGSSPFNSSEYEFYPSEETSQSPHVLPDQTRSLFKRIKAQAQDLLYRVDPLHKNVTTHAYDLQQKITPLSKQIGIHTFKLLQKSGQIIKDVPFRQPSRSSSSSTILFPQSVTTSATPTSFFISYHKADRLWAEWIAWELEAANNSVILPTWDFQLGSHLDEEMRKAAAKAECTIIVLSPDFLDAPSIQQEWTTISQKNLINGQKLFLPVCVRECGQKLEKLFGSTIYIDITGQDEETARKLLLDGVHNQRRKPITQPSFPGILLNTQIYSHSSSAEKSSLATKIQTQPVPPRNIKIFVSYSHNDKELRRELEKYLKNLKRLHAVTSWHDGEIPAGGEWAHEIEEHLSNADIILLLISQDFIASEYCYDQEMVRAMAKHEAKEAQVIPIMLRPSHWEITPFSKIQALPTGGLPITSWKDRDAAFLDVAKGIQQAVELLTKTEKG